MGALLMPLLGGNWSIIVRALGAVLLVGGLWFWWHTDRVDYAEDQVHAVLAQQASEGQRIAKARQVVTERVVTQLRQVEGKTKVVTEEIEKKVIEYVAANPGSNVIDAEWVRLHNAAASNISDPGQRPDGPVREAPGYQCWIGRGDSRISFECSDAQLLTTSPVRGQD